MQVSLLFASQLLLSQNAGTYVHFGTSDSLQHHGLPVPDIQELPRPQLGGRLTAPLSGMRRIPSSLTQCLILGPARPCVYINASSGERVWDD